MPAINTNAFLVFTPGNRPKPRPASSPAHVLTCPFAYTGVKGLVAELLRVPWYGYNLPRSVQCMSSYDPSFLGSQTHSMLRLLNPKPSTLNPKP